MTTKLTATSPTKRFSLKGWIKRYPARAAGWMSMPSSLALIASGTFTIDQGDVGYGGFILAASALRVIGNGALICWGDPKVTASQASVHKDIQDQSFWHRITSPRKAVHEFTALMTAGATLGLLASTIFAPTAVGVVMGVSATLGTAVLFIAERKSEPVGADVAPSSAFNRLVESGKHWVQERPLRAAFWLFTPCTTAMMFDGYARKDIGMFVSGAASMAAIGLRSLSSKRTRIIPENQNA